MIIQGVFENKRREGSVRQGHGISNCRMVCGVLRALWWVPDADGSGLVDGSENYARSQEDENWDAREEMVGEPSISEATATLSGSASSAEISVVSSSS